MEYGVVNFVVWKWEELIGREGKLKDAWGYRSILVMMTPQPTN